MMNLDLRILLGTLLGVPAAVFAELPGVFRHRKYPDTTANPGTRVPEVLGNQPSARSVGRSERDANTVPLRLLPTPARHLFNS